MSECYGYCFECCCELEESEVRYMEDEIYCESCFEHLTVICYACGERIFAADSAGNDTTRPLCHRCYEEYYGTCEECDALILREDGYYDDDENFLCRNCMRESPIYGYSYKPEPVFYGKEGNLFLGVELEMDEGGTDRENASALKRIAGNHIYIKTDGSLNDGFEVVTHPMTLQYHMEEMPWKKLLEEAVWLGYQSHKASTCGLHCHVNRTAFGEDYDLQEINIGKVLFLVEKYWDELLRFSRRTQSQMDRWAARYGFKENPDQVLQQAKHSGIGRYACINLENHNTIEFRMWRGTLKYNTLIATLQMVKRLCEVAIFYSEKELQDMSWWRFVSRISEPELITYLKERRLYINEPVEMDEEE